MHRLPGRQQSDNKEQTPHSAHWQLFQETWTCHVLHQGGLRRGYYQIRIDKGMRRRLYVSLARYKDFDWLVMPFILTNTHATF